MELAALAAIVVVAVGVALPKLTDVGALAGARTTSWRRCRQARR